MDFNWAAENRERVLAEWTKRYNARPKRSIPRPNGGAAFSSSFLTCAASARRSAASPRCRDIDLQIPRASSSASWGRRAAARPRCCASSPGWRCRRAAASPGRARHLAAAAGAARLRHRVPEYALFPNLSVADNVAYGLVNRKAPRPRSRQRVTELVKLVGLPGSEGKYPASCRAGSSSALRWRARWPPRRACCCWTSRCRRWTPSCACTCARRSAPAAASWV
jgi:hypothetical protein